MQEENARPLVQKAGNKGLVNILKGFPGSSVVKNPPANAGDTGSIPVLGRSPGGGQGNPLQYSCLENLMDRGTWQATVIHGVTKSWTRLKQLSTRASLLHNNR